MRPWFLGLSLSAPPESGQPVTVCVMDRWRRCRLLSWRYDPGAAGLLPEEVEREGFVLAIGAADAVGRDLLASLERRGYRPAGGADRHADLVLIDTDDLWKAWGVRPAPRRREPVASRRRQYEVLRAQGLDLSSAGSAGPADQLDAAAAAYAGYQWATGQRSCAGSRLDPGEPGPGARGNAGRR